MIVRKTPQLPSPSFWSLKLDPSPQLSPVLADCDADDEANMSADDFVPSRPLSVARPSGPSCPQRPVLDDILANIAPPPYTLSAFTAYLSQNHCLETLEFTTDAKRYQESYDQIAAQMAGMPLTADSEETEHLRMLWQRMLDAYVIPGAPREINLPSEVRDELLDYPHEALAPPPEILDATVKRIHELMEESIFMPFLNSFTTFSAAQTYTSPYRDLDEPMSMSGASLDHRGIHRHTSRRHRSPPPSTMDFSSSRSPSSGHGSRPSNSNLTSALGRSGSRLSAQISHSSNLSGDSALTDDSGSASSPGKEPMTPPTTPPSGDIGLGGHSPKTRSDSGTWKKMGMKLGWTKKKSAGALREGRFPATEEE